MSDFDDSYHLVGDVTAAHALLVRAGRGGIILPEDAPFTCVLANQPEGGIDASLIAANTGQLLVYRYAEDHGIWIDLYDGTNAVASLAFEWGPDFFEEGLPRSHFDAAAWVTAGLLDFARASTLKKLAASVAEGGKPPTQEEVAKLFGLTCVAYLACDPTNVKRGPWDYVVKNVTRRFPDAIVIAERKTPVA